VKETRRASELSGVRHCGAMAVLANFDWTGRHFASRRAYQIKAAAGRQEHAEAGGASVPVAKTPERNSAVVLLNDAFADPEPETGPLGRFSAEEWLKKSSRVLSLDSYSSIDDGDCDSAPPHGPVIYVTDRDAKFAAAGHGLNGIDDQV